MGEYDAKGSARRRAQASALQSIPSRRRSQRPAKSVALLRSWSTLPGYLRDNEYIITGYRANWSVRDTLRSLFLLHNETGNVWTHLLGGCVLARQTFWSERALDWSLPLCWYSLCVERARKEKFEDCAFRFAAQGSLIVVRAIPTTTGKSENGWALSVASRNRRLCAGRVACSCWRDCVQFISCCRRLRRNVGGFENPDHVDCFVGCVTRTRGRRFQTHQRSPRVFDDPRAHALAAFGRCCPRPLYR